MNYYELLELEPDCEQADIKTAYHRLCKLYHPDKNRNKGLSNDEMKELSQRYKNIQKAYDVLSKPETREEYDKSGLTIDQGDTVLDPYDALMSMIEETNKSGIPDVVIGVDATLRQLYKGFTKEVEFTRVSPCQKCDATGTRNKKDGSCGECSGRGAILETVEGGKVGYKYVEKMCSYCRGTGLDPDIKKCKKCDGNRYYQETIECDVEMPPGAYEGYYVKLESEGNYVPMENRSNHDDESVSQHDRTDVIIVIGDIDYTPQERPDKQGVIIPQYNRGIVIKELKRADRADLMIELELSFAESICGATRKIYHLNRSTIGLEINHSVVNGDIVVIERMGMPVLEEERENRQNKGLDESFGDLFVRIKVNRPEFDSATKQKLWQTLTKTPYQKRDRIKKPLDYCFLDEMIKNTQKSDDTDSTDGTDTHSDSYSSD